jgi:hypothetical protein
MGILADTHEEVVGFDITMEDVFLMHELDSVQDLLA